MEEFHEVTRQYLSCVDPVEAAARRQRVLYSDANGLMKATAASIMENSLSLQTPHTLSRINASNTATPPPLQDAPFHTLLYLDPTTLNSPQVEVEEDTKVDPSNSDAPPHPLVDPSRSAGRGGTARIKFVIVSPLIEGNESPAEQQSPLELTEEHETLQEFQNKVKKKDQKSIKG